METLTKEAMTIKKLTLTFEDGHEESLEEIDARTWWLLFRTYRQQLRLNDFDFFNEMQEMENWLTWTLGSNKPLCNIVCYTSNGTGKR